MPESSDTARHADPSVSIILPTYNRSAFLAPAFRAIATQHFQDWELIVVDDGSTDDTRERCDRFAGDTPQPVRYIRQSNQGAYGARNTGLDAARGACLAFYDSDDEWLPHHLSACVAALDRHADVDWVYGASEIVDHATGRVIADHSFYVRGRPRPFLGLRVQARGDVRVIDDPEALRCMILNGLYCGLQNSVFRRRVFESWRFDPDLRNGQDQILTVRALAGGFRLAYLDQVHVRYHMHAGNSSMAATSGTVDQRLKVLRSILAAYERLPDQVPLSSRERRALRQRLGREYFWKLGYATLWQAGRHGEAIRMYRRGLRHWPWDWRCWKTYALALLRR